MQILEASALGVRAAIAIFVHREDALQFELFPMVHVAEPQFYAAVRARLNACDRVLYEGVRSVRGRLLTLSYSLVARRKRLGLVCQSAALPRSSIEARLVHADLSAPEFDQYWRKVPPWQRLLFYVAAPVYGAYRFLVSTRASLARRLTGDDLPSADDAWDPEGDFAAFHDAILTRRDAHLLSCILHCHQESRSEPKRVAVLYGAAHMPAVVQLLWRLGYRVEESEWLTVFEI